MTTESHSQLPMLSTSAIARMRLMAADANLSQTLVQDTVCIGSLVMMLSNEDSCIVTAALEVLLRLADWPNLVSALKQFIGMKSQLTTLFALASCDRVRQLATDLYTLLYCTACQNVTDITDSCPSPPSLTPLSTARPPCVKRGASVRHRRNSFFVSGVYRVKVVILQLDVEMDMELCRGCLLTVPGVISITFDVKKRRAIVRTKADLDPEKLAAAIFEATSTTVQLVVKHADGSESVETMNARCRRPVGDTTTPLYPCPELGSPAHSGDGQHVVPQALTDDRSTTGRSWAFLQTIGNILSNSLYW